MKQMSKWIGWRENSQYTPLFEGENHGFLQNHLNRSIEDGNSAGLTASVFLSDEAFYFLGQQAAADGLDTDDLREKNIQNVKNLT